MRVQFPAVPVLVLCLLAGVASAQESMRVSPTSLRPGDESFLTIYVDNVVATNVVTVTYAGPAGQFSVEASAFGDGYIVAYVPDLVMQTAGRYSVDVYVLRGELTQRYGPGFFNVEIPPDEVVPLSILVPEFVIVEATSLKGAVASYDVSSSDGTPVSCNPPSGSTFPLGGTTVLCTATRGTETVTERFPVMVTDTTPPSIVVPDSIVTDNAVVHFTVTATDALDPAPVVVCNPASGSTFPGGVTRVNCFATDHHLNYARGSFTVTVTGGPPALVLPDDIVQEATGPDGAVVNYEASAVDGVVTCAPLSGSLFRLGETVVNCSATNTKGTNTGSFKVTVDDFTAPVLLVPADMTVSKTSAAGAVVEFITSATDTVSGSVPVVCAPPSGSTFAVGPTQVHCSAKDARGNTDFGSFQVTVVDNPPPVITVPSNITREATGPNGRTVSFNVTATNDGVITCSPAAGSVFPLGTTQVNCTATNAGGSDTRSFKITIVDTTPPTLTVPAGITAEATSPAGAAVAFVTTATDIVDGSVGVTCAPSSGSTFALGTTLVQCAASDTRGNTARDSFNVNVVDTTAPIILSVKPSTASLWPPNHKMEPVTLSVIAIDAADLTPTSTIISVSSNQPINGTGDGDTAPDWVITGPLTVQLRSERAGTQDRVYTIRVQTTDDSGNSSTATTTVRVTQSRRR